MDVDVDVFLALTTLASIPSLSSFSFYFPSFGLDMIGCGGFGCRYFPGYLFAISRDIYQIFDAY